MVTKWYASKTLWTNSLVLVAMIVQGVTGREVISLEIQAMLLSVVNIILRFVTKSPVVW